MFKVRYKLCVVEVPMRPAQLSAVHRLWVPLESMTRIS